ncbi:MAG: hypothetical protein N2444_03725, partial [Methylocystis sp.]|nr:hypothetical protein [Methylocystis sp.]
MNEGTDDDVGNRRTPGQRVLYAFLALAFALLFGWAWRAGYVPGSTAPTPKKDERAEGPITVSVTQARVTDFPVTIDAVGTVQALNT